MGSRIHWYRSRHKRVKDTLSTIKKLETWHGHLHNWYNEESEAFAAFYISTVDSGNFVGYLMALRQGLSTCSRSRSWILSLAGGLRHWPDEPGSENNNRPAGEVTVGLVPNLS